MTNSYVPHTVHLAICVDRRDESTVGVHLTSAPRRDVQLGSMQSMYKIEIVHSNKDTDTDTQDTRCEVGGMIG